MILAGLTIGQGAGAADLAPARALLHSQQPQAAFEQLQVQEADSVDDVEFNFLLGYSALLSQRYQEALIAFDRALAVDPSHAGARIQLGRTLYALGAYDLAKVECRRALELEVTESLKLSIYQLIGQIDATQSKQKRYLAGYLEYQVGHDSNVSSAINSTGAYQSALLNTYPLFRELGMEAAPPSGNAVLQQAPFQGMNVGLQAVVRYQPAQSLYANADAQRRNYYASAQAFNATSINLSGGSVWEMADASLRVTANLLAFRQEGLAAAGLKTSNDKQSWGLAMEYRPTLSGALLPSLSASYAQTEVPYFKAQETEQAQLGAGLVWKSLHNDRQLVLLAYQYAKDYALAPLQNYDPSKVTQSIRVFGQTNGPELADLFFGLGWSVRQDSAYFGRGQQNVEFGRDTLTDWVVGVQRGLGADWTLKAQLMASQNRSNIPLFEFERREISVFVRRGFR